MLQPLDLVIVRHGQSEGNLAQETKMEYPPDFVNRHNSQYRLTDLGRYQACKAGIWLKKHFKDSFDKFYTSEYVRAMETAGYMDLSNARWVTEVYLRERDRGVMAGKSKNDRIELYQEELQRKKLDGFYWQPVGGESIANLCLRVDQFLQHLTRVAAGLKVIVVAHGGVIKAIRALLEKTVIPEADVKINNTHIIWYTRKCPFTGRLATKFK